MKGLCGCGCGQPTEIAKRTEGRWGFVKGEPKRYVRGHGKRRFEWHEEDRGYTTPCHIWDGTFTEGGYPTVLRDGKRTTAHRYLFIEEHGPIPDDWDVDHKCEVKACVNLDHLEALTRSEHNFRTWARKKAAA